MRRFLLNPLFGLAVGASVAFAEPSVDDALLGAARKALPVDISTNEIARVLNAGLWNPEKTAVAVSFARPEASLVFVFIRRGPGKYQAVDVSGVEGGNFGKLGIAGRKGYERFETTPIRWMQRDDGLYFVEIRTRAWKSGKRFTVSEPMLISTNGTPLWR